MGSNGTNFTNTTGVASGGYSIHSIMYVYYTSEIFFAVVGTLLNLWFLVAILSSRVMRSRLRNKIICNTLVVHLLDSTFIVPSKVSRFLSDRNPGCVFFTVTLNLQLIQDFIVNWLLVMLLAVFIAQIKDFNPKTKLTPTAATMGTVGMMVLPWAASIIVVPNIVHDIRYMQQWITANCFYPTKDAYQVFKSIDTSAPILLAFVLLIVAAALRYRRFTPRSSSGTMQAELISSGPEIDSTFAYLAAVAVSITCDLIRLIMCFDYYIFQRYNTTWLNLHVIAMIMSDSRVILMTLPWFFFHDIRQRVRTWRPWNRPPPGVDVNVAYRKEEI